MRWLSAVRGLLDNVVERRARRAYAPDERGRIRSRTVRLFLVPSIDHDMTPTAAEIAAGQDLSEYVHDVELRVVDDVAAERDQRRRTLAPPQFGHVEGNEDWRHPWTP